MIYIGIDPGLNGGIAVLDPDGYVLATAKMPSTPQDVLDFFGHDYPEIPTDRRRPATAFAIIERVHSSPQMGVTSAFTFGKGYGMLIMALTASKVPFDEVAPRVWQRCMTCLSGGDKNVTKNRAQQLFPLQKVTHAKADALLLAEYCRRLHGTRA